MATSIENIARGFLEEDRKIREAREAKIAALPRFRFLCGRDFYYGPDTFQIGLLWGKNLHAMEGEIVYRRAFVLRWRFRLYLERH